MAQFTLRRALRMVGEAQAALLHLESARRRFEHLDAARMAAVALTDKAGCLNALGRYDEAAEPDQQTIAMAEQRNDSRSVAVNKSQLATVRFLQKKYQESLRLNAEAGELFEKLKEPGRIDNAARKLIRLKCGKPFSHVAQHWKPSALFATSNAPSAMNPLRWRLGNKPSKHTSHTAATAAFPKSIPRR